MISGPFFLRGYDPIHPFGPAAALGVLARGNVPTLCRRFIPQCWGFLGPDATE